MKLIAENCGYEISKITEIIVIYQQPTMTLIELKKDISLNLLYKKKSLIQFWIHIRKEYPHLFTIAIQHLLPFASTYLCEKGFSTMVNIQTKQRNRLRIDSCIRITLSNAINVRIDKLVECIQQHLLIIVAFESFFCTTNYEYVT